MIKIKTEKEIELMKTSAVIINTARGGIVNETALFSALKTGRIYGAGIDTFETEPPTNYPWHSLDNLVMGSHSAASTNGAVNMMSKMSAENIIRDLSKI